MALRPWLLVKQAVAVCTRPTRTVHHGHVPATQCWARCVSTLAERAAVGPSMCPHQSVRASSEACGAVDAVKIVGDGGAVPHVEVTDAMVSQYRRDGFLVLHDFLSPAQLDVWRAVVDDAVAERGKQKFHVDTAEDVTNVDFE